MTDPAKTQESDLNRIWLSDGFVRRARELHRTRLRDLYPSEAWSLYRVLPDCSTVLDLGCGHGPMSEIVRAISPRTRYTGVDLNPVFIESARNQFPSDSAAFVEADVRQFLETGEASRFDCVMAWALLYAIPDFERLIDLMIAASSRYVLFDMRVANVPSTITDAALAYTLYGGIKAPIVIASFSSLLRRLRLHDKELRSVEITGYDVPFGGASWIADTLPKPSVVSVLLERARSGDQLARPDWYVNVPPHLRDGRG